MATEYAPGMPHPADTAVSPLERRIMLLERHVSALRQNSRVRRGLDASAGGSSWQNVTITTTVTIFASTTFERPSWATEALSTAILGVQMTNNSGADQNLIAACEIADTSQQQLEATIIDGDTGAFTVPHSLNLTGLTGDVVIRGAAVVSSGTNVLNQGKLVANVIWLP